MPNKIQIDKKQNSYKFQDFEDRTTDFAKRIIRLCRALPKDSINYSLISQIIRSSGSVGANYREANEAVGRKDFIYRLRISRKEAKETQHWLELIREANSEFEEKMQSLFQEVKEIRNILSSMISKSEKK
jgi:four helix bundle protein